MALVITIVAGVVAGIIVLRLANNAIREAMKRLLGDYYEYAAMFFMAGLSLVGLLAALYFLVPLVVWLGIILAVVIGLLLILEFT